MKSLEAQKYQLNQKKQQAILGKKKYYKALTLKGEQKVQGYYQKKLDRALSEIEKRYKKKEDILLAQAMIMELKEKNKDKAMTKTGQKKLDTQRKKIERLGKKKQPTEAKVKQLAYTIFQLYIRISKSDKNGMCKLLDNGLQAYYTECDAGHYYPKSIYPQLAFNVLNVRPISKQCNKMQGDNIGERWNKGLLRNIDSYEWAVLQAIAGDKKAKNKLRDRRFFEKIIEEYSQLAIKEFDKRNIAIPRILHQFLKKNAN